MVSKAFRAIMDNGWTNLWFIIASVRKLGFLHFHRSDVERDFESLKCVNTAFTKAMSVMVR